jgi:small subunit ribosomal protein S6
MKNYELACILDPQLGGTSLEEVIENYENHLRANGAEISHIDRWGLRKLAYSSVGLKKRRQGYYVLFQFAAEPALLPPLEQRLKLDEGVLRFMVISVQGEFLRVPQLAPDSEILRESRPPREAEISRPPAPERQQETAEEPTKEEEGEKGPEQVEDAETPQEAEAAR